MTLTESMVEEVALGWFKVLGYPVRHGPPLTPWDLTAECEALGEGELEGRLCEASCS